MAAPALGAASIPATAGAWLQQESAGQVIFSSSQSFAGQRFDKTGAKTAMTGRFAKQAFAVTVEYGLSKDMTLLALADLQHQQLPLPDNQSSRPVSSFTGGGIRFRLWSSASTVVSLQGVLQAGGERNLAGRLQKNDAPAEADARLLLGHSFDLMGLPAFVEAQAGYRWRGGRNADELRLDLSIGLRPHPDFLLLAQSFNIKETTGNRRYGAGPSRQHKIQISGVYNLTRNWSVQAGAFTSLRGVDSLNETGAILALWRTF